MRMKNILLVLCSALSLISCSSTEVEPDDMAAALDQRGFSLAMPGDSGWIVAKKSPYKVLLVKPGTEMYERRTIQALVVKLPEFETDKDFLDYIQDTMGKDRDAAKYSLIEESVNFIENNEEVCVQHNSKGEDLVTQEKASSDTPVILEMVNMTCRHPFKAGAGVYIAYANRYFSGNADDNLGEDAIMVFQGLSFTDL